MPEPIISVSGLRGIVGESLTPEIAMRYASAFAANAPPGDLVISRDGRSTGEMLAGAIAAALSASGRNVQNIGVAATPSVGALIQVKQLAGGIQITASHNPPPYNGMKLFSPEGRVLSATIGEKTLQSYRNREPSWVAHDKVGGIVDESKLSWFYHLNRLFTYIESEPVAAKKFRVILDSNHGAGGALGEKILKTLGCQTTIYGAEPTGQFAHPPEPCEENLVSIAQAAKSSGADVTFCQDPDADRLAIIDETGRYIGEEYTLAICTKYMLSKTPGPIVTNCSTSRMSQDLAIAAGVPFSRSAVGEANVADEMIRVGAVFGGEGNGGPIDPRIGYIRDSFVGMALVLSAMAESGKTISQLVAELPRYSICKTKITFDTARLAAGNDALAKHFSNAKTDRLDGLRLDWPDAWLLVRPSNTEPIVRAIAEAPTAKRASELCKQAEAVLQSF